MNGRAHGFLEGHCMKHTLPLRHAITRPSAWQRDVKHMSFITPQHLFNHCPAVQFWCRCDHCKRCSLVNMCQQGHTQRAPALLVLTSIRTDVNLLLLLVIITWPPMFLSLFHWLFFLRPPWWLPTPANPHLLKRRLGAIAASSEIVLLVNFSCFQHFTLKDKMFPHCDGIHIRTSSSLRCLVKKHQVSPRALSVVRPQTITASE